MFKSSVQKIAVGYTVSVGGTLAVSCGIGVAVALQSVAATAIFALLLLGVLVFSLIWILRGLTQLKNSLWERDMDCEGASECINGFVIQIAAGIIGGVLALILSKQQNDIATIVLGLASIYATYKLMNGCGMLQEYFPMLKWAKTGYLINLIVAGAVFITGLITLGAAIKVLAVVAVLGAIANIVALVFTLIGWWGAVKDGADLDSQSVSE